MDEHDGADAIEQLESAGAPESLEIEPVQLRPKKTEIAVQRVALVWTPWWSGGSGTLTKAY